MPAFASGEVVKVQLTADDMTAAQIGRKNQVSLYFMREICYNNLIKEAYS